MGKDKYFISLVKWFSLIRQLRIRGEGRRESGAVLLGKADSNQITEFICLDELDPHCYVHGMIQFHASGFIKLWDYCRNKQLRVIADVHTHPRQWTGLSDTDIINPFISIPGHVAIVIPSYAKNYFQLKQGIGIYLYLGNYNWEKLPVSNLKLRLA